MEKEVATHSNILIWRTPWTEERGRLQSMGHKELDVTEQLNKSNIVLMAWGPSDSSMTSPEIILLSMFAKRVMEQVAGDL